MRLLKAFSVKDLFRLNKKIITINIPTTGWTSVVTGTGTVVQSANYQNVTSGITTGSTSLLHDLLHGLGIGGSPAKINFDKKLDLGLNFQIAVDDATITRYVQIKQANTIGDMAVIGLGIKIANKTLYGESFGTERGEVALGDLVVSKQYKLNIVLHPGIKIEWWLNGVLVGTQVTVATIPAGVAGANCYLVTSIANGAGAANAYMDYGGIQIIQEAI